jgi:hypothetical protein
VIQVGSPGMSEFSGGFACGGIDDHEFVAVGRVGPCAIDIELNVWIHGRLLARSAVLYADGYTDIGSCRKFCQAW